MLLLLDGNNIAFVCNTAQTLKAKNGMPTQAIYGIVESIKHYMDEFQPIDRMVIVFDGGHSKQRKALHPQYKERDKSKNQDKIKELNIQMPYIKEILSCLGIASIQMQDIEADDIIAYIALKNINDDTVIVSADKDFYQLINKDISIYSPVKKTKVRYLNSSNFQRVKGLRSSQWLDFRSMMGDSGDNISGIVGVGESTALDILKRFGSYRTFRKMCLNNNYIIQNKYEKKAFEGLEQFELSKRLMNLIDNEMFQMPSGRLAYIKHGKKNKKRIIEIFKELDIKNLIHSVSWIIDKAPDKPFIF